MSLPRRYSAVVLVTVLSGGISTSAVGQSTVWPIVKAMHAHIGAVKAQKDAQLKSLTITKQLLEATKKHILTTGTTSGIAEGIRMGAGFEFSLWSNPRTDRWKGSPGSGELPPRIKMVEDALETGSVMDAVNRIDEAIPMIYQDIHRVKAEVERIANTMTDLGL